MSQITGMGFRKALAARQEKVESLVCVGLDPLPEKLPLHIAKENKLGGLADKVYIWMRGIVCATAQFASMFKPQIAHWEAIGPAGKGIAALGDLIRYIQNCYSDTPVFLDCKRGDINRTQERYRVAAFDILGADGANFSPYMGESCMAGLVDKENLGRGLAGLCYTSNPSARRGQDIFVELDSVSRVPYWQFIAMEIFEWARRLGVAENAGLVMAAAYEKQKGSGEIYYRHLEDCRGLIGNNLWFLIPGIGAQGGFIKQTVLSAFTGWGSIAINSSSEICFASNGTDFAEAAAKKAQELRDKINESLQ